MSGIVGTSHSRSKVIGKSQDTAKAWINFNGATADDSTNMTGVRGSFNVSSLIDLEEGKQQINFIVPMPNVNYAVGGLSSYDLASNPYRHVHWYRREVGFMSVVTVYNNTTTFYDAAQITLIVFGD